MFWSIRQLIYSIKCQVNYPQTSYQQSADIFHETPCSNRTLNTYQFQHLVLKTSEFSLPKSSPFSLGFELIKNKLNIISRKEGSDINWNESLATVLFSLLTSQNVKKLNNWWIIDKQPSNYRLFSHLKKWPFSLFTAAFVIDVYLWALWVTH